MIDKIKDKIPLYTQCFFCREKKLRFPTFDFNGTDIKCHKKCFDEYNKEVIKSLHKQVTVSIDNVRKHYSSWSDILVDSVSIGFIKFIKINIKSIEYVETCDKNKCFELSIKDYKYCLKHIFFEEFKKELAFYFIRRNPLTDGYYDSYISHLNGQYETSEGYNFDEDHYNLPNFKTLDNASKFVPTSIRILEE